MQVVYDDVTQSLIDFYQGRISDHVTSIESHPIEATSICHCERHRQLYPHYHPLYDNPEYKALCKQLTDVYSMAVPKYIISVDVYKNLVGKVGATP